MNGTWKIVLVGLLVLGLVGSCWYENARRSARQWTDISGTAVAKVEHSGDVEVVLQYLTEQDVNSVCDSWYEAADSGKMDVGSEAYGLEQLMWSIYISRNPEAQVDDEMAIGEEIVKEAWEFCVGWRQGFVK